MTLPDDIEEVINKVLVLEKELGEKLCEIEELKDEICELQERYNSEMMAKDEELCKVKEEIHTLELKFASQS